VPPGLPSPLIERRPDIREAEQLINSGNTAAIDRAAIETEMSALGRFLITKKEPAIATSPP
jgi:hypothetical protein